jgi:hypothetical protein
MDASAPEYRQPAQKGHANDSCPNRRQQDLEL